jgi:hypothetical protein
MSHIKTPAWVVENCLPDYKNRLAAYIAECRKNNVNDVLDWVLTKEFCATHFPEALTEFAYRIVRRTLETCEVERPANESLRDYFDDVIKGVAMPVAHECTNDNPSGLNEYREGCKQNCDECDYYQPVKK